MNKRTDTIRLAEYVAAEFSIYTNDPTRLGQYARDLLKSGRSLTMNLRESAERASQW